MAPTLNLFGAAVRVYGLILLLAAWLGLWLAARQARRLGLNEDHVYNLGFYALLATLLGARLPVGATLDALAPGAALALALERLGAFLDGRGFGEPTTLPWGVYLGDRVRHPVQLYETAALLVILGVLWWGVKRSPFQGYHFTLFVALYAGARLFLEAFRADASLMANGVRTVQVIALGVMLGAIGYLYRRRFPFTPTASGHARFKGPRNH